MRENSEGGLIEDDGEGVNCGVLRGNYQCTS